MKKILLIIALASSILVLHPGCQTPPSARVVQVQTLKSVGQSAEAAVALSAQLFQSGTITSAQARQVLDFYNLKFQPAFRLSVAAVSANLDTLADPAVISLANQLAALVVSLQPTH